MSYSQAKKLTDTEKKLQVLRLQLYGKAKEEKSSPASLAKFKSDILSPVSSNQTSADLSFLNKDLRKIFLLALAAISIQLVIYFFHINTWLKF